MVLATGEDPVSRGSRWGPFPLFSPQLWPGSRGRQDSVWEWAGAMIGSTLSPQLVPPGPASCHLVPEPPAMAQRAEAWGYGAALRLEKPRPTGLRDLSLTELRQTGLAELAGNNKKAPCTSQTRPSGSPSPPACEGPSCRRRLFKGTACAQAQLLKRECPRRAGKSRC